MKYLCCLLAALAVAVALTGCGGGPRSRSFTGDFETGDLSQWSETREAQRPKLLVE